MKRLKQHPLQFMVLLIICLFHLQAFAHEQSIAKISVYQVNQNKMISWKVGLKDLSRVIYLDDNLDNKIQWKEVIDNQQELSGLFDNSIQVESENGRCTTELEDIDLIKLSSGNGLNVRLVLNCQSPIESIHYSFLKDLDRLHVAYVEIKLDEFTGTYLFNNQSDRMLLPESNQDFLSVGSDNEFIKFVYQGVLHIWIGLDHLSFLLILLFSARTKKMAKVIDLKQLLAFVTTFTIAHSITLISASLDLIRLPSWIVETIIAVSVGWGALLIIRGESFINTPTVFGFGLVHGLGFASVLADLTGSLSTNSLLLLGFNLGVEFGQIVFLLATGVCFYIPIHHFGIQATSRFTSIPILLVACVWTIERVMDVQLINLN